MQHSSLEACNHTELYQLCQKANLNPSPAQSREQLMQLLIEGPTDGNPPPHPINPWRNGLAGFVLDHWNVLQNQITCPLRSKDPMSCFGCLDAQVVTCVVNNPNNEPLIARHRK